MKKHIRSKNKRGRKVRMDFKIIQKTCRSFTAELVNQDIYFSKESYNIYLNGKCVVENEKINVFSVYGLTPKTEYEVAIETKNLMYLTMPFYTQCMDDNPQTICIE